MKCGRSLGLFALLLTHACASRPATQPSPRLTIQAPFWLGPDPHSPALPGGAFDETPALEFSVLEATGSAGPTLAIFVSARVPGPIAERYGGRLPSALHIIAQELAAPVIHHGTATPPHAAPLVAAPSAGADDGATPTTVSTWINGDLGLLANLPPAGGRYRVYVWLDELVSEPQLVTVPSAAGRSEQRPTPRTLTATRVPDAAPRAALSARLDDRAGAPCLTISSRPPEVIVLAICGPSRALDWGVTTSAVQLDPRQLAGCGTGGDLLVLAEGERIGPLHFLPSSP